jgi:hypothetical protein
MTSLTERSTSGKSEGKVCSICGEWKDYSNFTRHATMRDGHMNRCKSCVNQKGREARAANGISDEEKTKRKIKDKKRYDRITSNKKLNTERKQKMRSAHLYRTYGITLEEYEHIHKAQNGCCGICQINESDAPRKVLSVDHCHDTGQIRGLLCDRCNLGVGMLGDNLNSLQKAVDYLRRTG